MSTRSETGLNAGDPTRPRPFDLTVRPPEWMARMHCEHRTQAAS